MMLTRQRTRAMAIETRRAELQRRLRALELAAVPHPIGEANQAWRKESDALRREWDALIQEQTLLAPAVLS